MIIYALKKPPKPKSKHISKDVNIICYGSTHKKTRIKNWQCLLAMNGD